MAIEPAQFELHRKALSGHCYRMMGSMVDADDAVQETLVRAWRHREKFDERAALKTWLYRIATNVCLDLLDQRGRRNRPIENGSAGTIDDTLESLPRTHWLEPVAEAWALPTDADPSERIVLKQSIRLAFVAALQHLPPKQRAVLLLTEVLGWSANEVAESLELTVASVNSALQRARATLEQRAVLQTDASLTDAQTALVDRYYEAFVRYDVDALVSLLHHDATLSMPPYSLWLKGHEPIRQWLSGRGSGCCGSRLIRVNASGLPAFAQYRPSPEGGYSAWAIIVLELEGDRITAFNSFLDTDTLFARFGLEKNISA